MQRITYTVVHALWWLLSLLPLRVLYGLSDLLYYPLYYLIRYRRKIVRQNLRGSFPEKSEEELVAIEKRFYHFFADYVVETIKLPSISKEELMKRMTFDGIDEIEREMAAQGTPLGFVYLGHFGNWEWIASLQYWVRNDVHCAQIYHPLRNATFDKLFLDMRNHFGGECIPMKITLRRMVELRKANQKSIIGFISDQLPKWSSIHHFTPFLHRDTAFFTGTEQMGKRLGAVIFYADVSRPTRGTYHCHFRKLVDAPASLPDYAITDAYARQLEQMIRQTPHLWLWTHNRWKRTKEEYLKRNHDIS